MMMMIGTVNDYGDYGDETTATKHQSTNIDHGDYGSD